MNFSLFINFPITSSNIAPALLPYLASQLSGVSLFKRATDLDSKIYRPRRRLNLFLDLLTPGSHAGLYACARDTGLKHCQEFAIHL
jgi:hypothetical protein